MNNRVLLLTISSVLLLFSSISILSCKDKKQFCESQPQNVPLRFRLVDHSGRDLLNSSDSVFVGNITILAPCFGMHDNTSNVTFAPDSFFCVASRTSYSGPNVDYVCQKLVLKYSRSFETDTITYDAIKNGNNGCTSYVMSNVRFNGVLSGKASVYGDSVLLFVK